MPDSNKIISQLRVMNYQSFNSEPFLGRSRNHNSQFMMPSESSKFRFQPNAANNSSNARTGQLRSVNNFTQMEFESSLPQKRSPMPRNMQTSEQFNRFPAANRLKPANQETNGVNPARRFDNPEMTNASGYYGSTGRVGKNQPVQNMHDSTKYTKTDLLHSLSTNLIRPVIESSKKDDKQISMTKFLSMEFKVEGLEKKVQTLESKVQELNTQLAQADKQKCEMKRSHETLTRQIKMEADKKVRQMERDCQIKLSKKNAQVQKLVKYIADSIPSQLQQHVRTYIETIQAQSLSLAQNFKELEKKHRLLQNENSKAKTELNILVEKEKQFTESNRKLSQHLSLVNTSLKFKNPNSLEVVIAAQTAQIEQLTTLKTKLESDSLALRDTFAKIQKSLDNAYNDINTTELKQRAESSKIITELGVELTTKTNEIQALRRKLATLEERYKLSTNEIKAKDEFIKQYLMGRTSDSDMKKHISDIFQEYSKKFSPQTHQHYECVQKINSMQRQLLAYKII